MTDLPRPGADDVLYLFDMHAWVYRFWHATGEWAALNTARFVGRVLQFRRPAFAAVCRDLPGPTFRHLLAPQRPGVLSAGSPSSAPSGYKAQREGPDPALIERITWAHEMLEDAHGLPVYSKPGFEADDLIASLTHQALRAGMRVVIVAADKDLMQLVSAACVLWDGKDAVTGPPEVEARFGVRVDQLRDYLAICGDSSDNIPGLRGAGPKAAVAILSAFGTLDAAIESAQDDAASAPLWNRHAKYRVMLREQAADVRLSQRLVTLAHDVPISLSMQEVRR